MSYTPNVPISGQTLGNSRPIINANFQSLNTAFSVNHVALNAAGQGKHKFVEMPVGSLPAGLVASEGTLYTKTAGESQLFYSPDNSGNEYQLTKTITGNFATFGTNTVYVANHFGGWTFLPGGLLLQWGFRSTPGASGAITFPVAFPNGLAPYLVNVSLYRSTGDHNVLVDRGTPPTASGFNYICDTGGSIAVYWTAIGGS